MIKIIVNGAAGKMGALAVKTLRADPSFDIIAELGRSDNLAQSIRETRPDVVLDLTTAEFAYKHTKIILEAESHPVIGTSGLTETQISFLTKLAKDKNLGGIIVPNFSIGAVLMMQFSEIAAPYFDQIKIHEVHHPAKKDKPSGTARRTAELAAAAKNIPYEAITIESELKPNALAEQTVSFSRQHENFSISNQILDRACFMPGLVLACKAASSLKELLVGLDKIM